MAMTIQRRVVNMMRTPAIITERRVGSVLYITIEPHLSKDQSETAGNLTTNNDGTISFTDCPQTMLLTCRNVSGNLYITRTHSNDALKNLDSPKIINHFQINDGEQSTTYCQYESITNLIGAPRHGDSYTILGSYDGLAAIPTLLTDFILPPQSKGLFTINGNGDTIEFSPGNLACQLYQSNGHQVYQWFFQNWDECGSVVNPSNEIGIDVTSYVGIRDMFCPSCTGHCMTSDPNNTAYMPFDARLSNDDSFNWLNNPEDNICTPGDFGYNHIANKLTYMNSNQGSSTVYDYSRSYLNLWRSLTSEELHYIIKERINCPNRCTVFKCTDHPDGYDICGMILIPDDLSNYTTSPQGVHLNDLNAYDFYEDANGVMHNNLTIDEITSLTQDGYVILPINRIDAYYEGYYTCIDKMYDIVHNRIYSFDNLYNNSAYTLGHVRLVRNAIPLS